MRDEPNVKLKCQSTLITALYPVLALKFRQNIIRFIGHAFSIQPNTIHVFELYNNSFRPVISYAKRIIRPVIAYAKITALYPVLALTFRQNIIRFIGHAFSIEPNTIHIFDLYNNSFRPVIAYAKRIIRPVIAYAKRIMVFSMSKSGIQKLSGLAIESPVAVNITSEDEDIKQQKEEAKVEVEALEYPRLSRFEEFAVRCIYSGSFTVVILGTACLILLCTGVFGDVDKLKTSDRFSLQVSAYVLYASQGALLFSVIVYDKLVKYTNKWRFSVLLMLLGMTMLILSIGIAAVVVAQEDRSVPVIFMNVGVILVRIFALYICGVYLRKHDVIVANFHN